MGENSKIEWCHHTFNPWIGCAHVSPGCEHCYAEHSTFVNVQRSKERELWGVNSPRHMISEAKWREPLQWESEAREAGERRRVFCASLADVFEDRDDLIWQRLRLLDTIERTPNLDWLLLTKRIVTARAVLEKTMRALLTKETPSIGERNAWRERAKWIGRWLAGAAPPNVWVGCTVEDQRRAEERIPALIDFPADVRFLSCEPLLESVDLPFAAFNGADSFGAMPGLDWIIVGGESNVRGVKARRFDLEWARKIRNDALLAGVAFFMKQAGDDVTVDGTLVHIRKRKGGDLDELPLDLRVREFPIVAST